MPDVLETSPPLPAPEQAETPRSGGPQSHWVYTQQYGWIWMPYEES